MLLYYLAQYCNNHLARRWEGGIGDGDRRGRHLGCVANLWPQFHGQSRLVYGTITLSPNVLLLPAIGALFLPSAGAVSYIPATYAPFLLATGDVQSQVICSCMLKVYCFLHATHALFLPAEGALFLPAHVIYFLPASFVPFLLNCHWCFVTTGALFLHVKAVLFPSCHKGALFLPDTCPLFLPGPQPRSRILSCYPRHPKGSLHLWRSPSACEYSVWIQYLNISYLLICFYNWKVSEWNLPIFIKEQPYVVVLQGPLVEGGGISVVFHLEVGREGGVGHSAIERLPNWAES